VRHRAVTSGPPPILTPGCGEDFGSSFSCHRILRDADLPASDPRIVDIAILDMHHDWPNLGLDSLVRGAGEIARDLQPLLETAGLRIRALSYDVRRSRAVPAPPGSRHMIYIGSGGPGSIDPRANDGHSAGTQGILEDPAWEEPAFRLFSSILHHPDAVLLAVCHTFGVLCRWAGIAVPVLRPAEKGGKSSGIVQNWLTDEAVSHPWFSRFAALSDGRRFSVLDSRLYDLVPVSRPFPAGIVPLSYEADPAEGRRDNALTMVEYARDKDGVMPRMLAVNHHPEIRDRRRQRRILDLKLARGDVSREWYEERSRSLVQGLENPAFEYRVLLTSQFTLIAPLRFHLYRQVRVRAEQMGFACDLHEEMVLQHPSGTLDREENGTGIDD